MSQVRSDRGRPQFQQTLNKFVTAVRQVRRACEVRQVADLRTNLVDSTLGEPLIVHREYLVADLTPKLSQQREDINPVDGA